MHCRSYTHHVRASPLPTFYQEWAVGIVVLKFAHIACLVFVRWGRGLEARALADVGAAEVRAFGLRPAAICGHGLVPLVVPCATGWWMNWIVLHAASHDLACTLEIQQLFLDC